ncbi:ABC transporter ATP-binding protein [Acidaminococcus sp. CAG:542]|uniref:ABC transporter ATP-binding protein n=1 Tax=Acidaminococcus sp. CAG:542 TaxID=1262687 RepID=UPI00033FBB94|nr:ABC transporter ATP-binding protein [Acidaminococcus sp. CAG:542]CDE94443.1 aBC transporter related protein [Acidaminococcus sp. CAG:542]
MNVIELKDIVKSYQMGDAIVYALNHVTVDFEQGKFTSIVGPSGSGKSTMMNILGCLDRPTSGEYYLEGKNIANYTDDELARTRNRRIGFVFQSFNLLNRLTAVENVALPLIYAGVNLEERTKRAEQALTNVGLGSRMYHKPNEMSGGQRQRVAIARALINNPAIIMADEPTGNLDTKSTLEIIDIFEKLNQEGKTVIMVTHEPELAAMTQRILVMRDGRLTEEKEGGGQVVV